MSEEVAELPFEEALSELEATIQHLEEGDLTLEEAIRLYERGMRLARRCSEALDTAELQVQQLTVTSDEQQLGMYLEEGSP
jgi:exodeoxyribonuclease VII small subunit